MMLEIILTSSVLILIIMLLRALCRKSIKPTLRYALWLVVALRLVLPFSLFSSNASVMNFFGRAGMVNSPAVIEDNGLFAPSATMNDVSDANAPADDYIPANPSVNEPFPPAGEDYIAPTAPADPANQESPISSINPTYPDYDIAPSVQDNFPQQNVPESAEAPAEASLKPTENQNTQPQTALDTPSADNKQPSVSVSLSISLFGRSFEFQPWLVNAVKAVWLTVAAAMGIWFFGVNIAFSISLRRNRRELDINAPLKVYAAKNISSPCLFGLFRPAVYVNERAADNESSLRFVIAHEYCHYRHGDMLWSLLRCALLSVYWFNPLVWAAAYLSKRDCECSCDEAAIKLLGEPLRIDYGKALVSMIPERRADLRLIGVASTSMSGSKRAVRERVKLIAKKPKNAAIAVVLVIAVLIAAVGCTFTSADNDKGKDLPETDIADTDNQPDKPDNADDSEDAAKPDDSESASGMRIEKYDSSELNEIGWKDTKPFILPIQTEHGVEDCRVNVKVDGDRLLRVSSFNPIGYGGLSVIKSGDDYCYFYDGKSLQIYYYNVTTGETTPLISNSYEGYTKQEFIDYFKQLSDKDTDGTYRDMWLSLTPYSYSISSDDRWLSYASRKWVENGEISAKPHIWLHNIETGEELIAEDLLASAISDDATFVRLLSDNRLLATNHEPDCTAYYIVNILTKEAIRILQAPDGAYSKALSEKYILVFDGDAHVYDITNSKSHEFLMAIDDYDVSCLVQSRCEGDCLAIAPNEDVAYVIDLANDKKEKFTPPDARYSIGVREVYNDTVVFDVNHKSSRDSYGNFVVKLDALSEADTPATELKLYSRHVEYSSEEYQKFVPEVYDMTPIYEILGEEAAQKALEEHYKREMLVRQSTPPLYRLIKDTGVTREQLEAYNQTAENKLSNEVIEALYYPYDTMASKALIGRLSIFYDGKAYSLSNAIQYMSYYLPGGLSSEFREDISKYWIHYAFSVAIHDVEGANKVVKEYAELLNSGESLEGYPISSIDYEKFYICDSSNNKKSQTMKIESCDLSTDDGAARWLEINRQNQTANYYLPIKLENRTVDCGIETAMAGNGKIADISYRPIAENLVIFGESSESCYIFDPSVHKIYRFDIATAECTPIISTIENGSFIESPEHYAPISSTGDGARYPLQVSPDGKWLLYRSDKWLKENVSPKDKYHTWLHNLETGEELLFDDVVIYANGYNKQFEYLLADGKILVSGDGRDGSVCYSTVDVLTMKSEELLSVPRGVFTFAASKDYIIYLGNDEHTEMCVYDIQNGSVHCFRFATPIITNMELAKSLGKCLVFYPDAGNVIIMNLECDTAVSLRAPNNIENGIMNYRIISDRLVLIEEYSTAPYKLYANIAVWTGLKRQARWESLETKLYGRHVEYSTPEYQKFIPEVYDLTPIYEILGEEKAAAAVADYYSLIREERQALPPLYRLVHSTGITREQLKKYNETAQSKLPDDVIEALYLDWNGAESAETERVKQALLAETSLMYNGNAYSLWEALTSNLPADVMSDYLGSIEGYVQRNCSKKWITHVANAKKEYANAAKTPKIGDTIYSFDMIASQGKQAVTYRIDVVFTGRDRHNVPSEDDPTVWGEFELRAFDKSGKQTGSVRFYSGKPGNQFGATGLDAQKLLGAFKTDIADNIIVYSSTNERINDGIYNAVIYGITFSGELFMYEIEDSDDFTFLISNPGASPESRIQANTIVSCLVPSDLSGGLHPNFEGDSPDTKYLFDFFSELDGRTMYFYRIDEENRKLIPHIVVNGYYSERIVDSVISELKSGGTRALYIRTSEYEAYVYYLVDEGKATSKDSGVYYRKTTMDENGKWHADGETMQVKTQADVAKWLVSSAEPEEDAQEQSSNTPTVTGASFEAPAEPSESKNTAAAEESQPISKYMQWYTAAEDGSAPVKLTKVEVPDGIKLEDRLASGKWFAYDRRQSFPDTGINDECVFNPENGEVEKIKIPDDFPGWLYGSTSAFIGGRYLYYWLSYSDGTEKLTAIDFDKNTADVIYSYSCDDYNWYDVYAIDDESYVSMLGKLNQADKVTACSFTCELRKTDGSAVSLFDSVCIDNGKTSKGLYPTCFFGDNGRIRAVCKETVNSKVRYYICDFSKDGKYLGRTRLSGAESLMSSGVRRSYAKAGEYAFINETHLVKQTLGDISQILSVGRDSTAVFTGDKFVYWSQSETGICIYDPRANTLNMLDLQKEIADLDTSDFYYLDIKDIGSGELLVEIKKWKNPDEYYILSDY